MCCIIACWKSRNTRQKLKSHWELTPSPKDWGGDGSVWQFHQVSWNVFEKSFLQGPNMTKSFRGVVIRLRLDSIAIIHSDINYRMKLICFLHTINRGENCVKTFLEWRCRQHLNSIVWGNIISPTLRKKLTRNANKVPCIFKLFATRSLFLWNGQVMLQLCTNIMHSKQCKWTKFCNDLRHICLWQTF